MLQSHAQKHPISLPLVAVSLDHGLVFVLGSSPALGVAQRPWCSLATSVLHILHGLPLEGLNLC